MRSCRAFTIVEVLVAGVVLTAGLLGLSATAGWVSRTIRAGEHATDAWALANRLLAERRAQPCGAVPTGPLTEGRLRIELTASPIGTAGEHVIVVVTAAHGGRERADTFSAVVTC